MTDMNVAWMVMGHSEVHHTRVDKDDYGYGYYVHELAEKAGVERSQIVVMTAVPA